MLYLFFDQWFNFSCFDLEKVLKNVYLCLAVEAITLVDFQVYY